MAVLLGYTANASGFTPFSQSDTQSERVCLSNPVFRIDEISCSTAISAPAKLETGITVNRFARSGLLARHEERVQKSRCKQEYNHSVRARP